MSTTNTSAFTVLQSLVCTAQQLYTSCYKVREDFVSLSISITLHRVILYDFSAISNAMLFTNKKVSFYHLCLIMALDTPKGLEQQCALPFSLPISLLTHSLRNFTQGPVNMYNCLVVTVSESTFENNHAQSVFTDLPSRVSGGGLSITIYDRSNSSVMQGGAFNYTIQNCTFFNNSANSTLPTAGTISILEGGHLNDRGGGVTFYLVHSIVVEIKVLGCNFTNNSASAFGGGLYAFSPKLVTEEDFTIADNHFEGNTAMSGGGVALGAVFQQQNVKENLNKTVLKESVVFNRNMFVQNKVTGDGGAMFLGPGGWVIGYNTHCLNPARTIEPT